MSASNDDVTYHARDATADVIASGREPSARSRRWSGPVLLLVIAQTAALIGSIAIALHYRGAASQFNHSRPVAANRSRSQSLPQLASARFRLPVDGAMAGTVLIAAVAEPGAAQGKFVVSAVISGGQPNTVYELTGNDCSAADPLPDHPWATGRTDATGTAELTGHPWTGALADEYWLALAPSSGGPPPGLRGRFVQGMATPFPADHAPCEPG